MLHFEDSDNEKENANDEDSTESDDTESQQDTQPTSNKKRPRIESTTTLSSDASSASRHEKQSPSDLLDHSSSDNDSTDTLATISFLKTHCWKCHVAFQLDNNDYCLYAMHTHPLLQIPICCVCADDVLAVELETAPSNTNVTHCHGCGREQDEVETLFLCDDCPRAFCEVCVACAHGGGDEGRNCVKVLAASDDQWLCPCCAPPEPLQSLQAHTKRIGEEEESKPRTMDDILLELDKVELERKECETKSLPHVIEQQRAEFRAELLQTVPAESVEEAVEEEMQEWMQMWADHDARLADRVLALQEEIELKGENLAGCYAAIQGETVVDKDEPEWKKAADAEVQRRRDAEDDIDEPQSKFECLCFLVIAESFGLTNHLALALDRSI